MPRIVWNVAGSRHFEAGVDRGVLYIDSEPGIPWIGLTSVEESPVGGEIRAYYVDGVKYLQVSGDEEFEATVKAYTYPVEFSVCDGTAQIRPGLFFDQQPRKPFGFSYRTLIGNDLVGVNYAYKIHLVYNALATPEPFTNNSFQDTIDAGEFSWRVATKPPSILNHKPSAHLVIDSRYTHPFTLETIENILYGTESNVARMPTAEELIEIFDTPPLFQVIDNGDGTYFVGGPDEMVMSLGMGMYVINHESVEIIDEDSFIINY